MIDYLLLFADSTTYLKNLYELRKAMEAMIVAKALHPSSIFLFEFYPLSNMDLSQHDIPFHTSTKKGEKRSKNSHERISSSIGGLDKRARDKDLIVEGVSKKIKTFDSYSYVISIEAPGFVIVKFPVILSSRVPQKYQKV